MPVFSKELLFDYLSSVSMLDLGKLAQKPQYAMIAYLHQQPFAPQYTKQILKKDGVERVLLGTEEEPKLFEQAYSEETQLGDASVTPGSVFYDHYGEGSPYGIYNWEIDFHLPMLIANRLSQTQRYEEAQRWYHFIFNPAQVQEGNAWVFKPFKDELFGTIEELLSDGDNKDFESWYENPFLPHAVASFRIEAYMMYTLMKYLDNLIEWGDNLFRRDTIESINEATQYYVLASDILGPKPKSVPKQINPNPLSYAQIKAQRTSGGNTEGLNNPRVDIALNAPYATDRPASEISGTSTLYGIVQNVGYFGVPANKKLLEYWDKVADRLFKIRNCQNIEGVVRELPLFEPPIDPALLIRAAQAGLDLSAVINDLYAPMPHYRFQVMLQKANEYCNEVKAFGNALLSALEKKDSEQLGIIRAKHEQNLLKQARIIKDNQRKEAEQALEGLRINHQAAEFRYKHYEKMLGNKDKAVPAFKKEEIIYIQDEYPNGFNKIKVSGFYEGGIQLIEEELQEIRLLDESSKLLRTASGYDFMASVFAVVPNFNIQPMGVGTTIGGSNFSAIMTALSQKGKNEASEKNVDANKSIKNASYILRQDEWMQQSRAAALEINQLKRQMLAAEVRMDIAQKEIENHEIQIQNAQEVLDFITGDESVVKFTSNATLYNWMIGQLMMLYRQSYKMAHDLAKQAERCYRYELGITDSNFIQFNYWDSDKKGLLSGDHLANSLRQMEKAYMDQNKRDFEITKHISLQQLNPLALLKLREEGKCDFCIPEELFDLDFPGHYMRRIKSVSITIPCIAGPYTSINATLRLKQEGKRTVAIKTGEMEMRNVLGQNIATSSAQNDGGLFELNFRDERYLPFEGAGAVSVWSLEMVKKNELRQFDYNTISDVIVHLRYTARDGGETLKEETETGLQEKLNELMASTAQTGLARLFSLRSDFPNEWHLWAKQGKALSIKLEKHHFPYFAQMGNLTPTGLTSYRKGNATPTDDGFDLENWAITRLAPAAGESLADDYFLIVHYTI